MRIALVSHYAPPQPAVASHRILRLTRALIAAGHEVDWVTLDPDLLPKRDETLAACIPAGVRSHGFGGPTLYALPSAPNFFAKVRRTLAFELPKRFPLFDGHFEWTARLKRHLPRLILDRSLDAVFVCCGPHGQIAVVPGLRRRFPDLRIFVDYRDLLSGNPWNERGSPGLRDRLRRREARTLRDADVLFLNTTEAEARFEAVVGPVEGLEVDVMRNAADYDLARELTAAKPTVRPDAPGAHLGFFGTLFPQRRLREVLLAMARMQPADRDRLTLHVYCDDRQSPPLLEEDCAEAGPDVRARVVRHPFVPYGDALRTMCSMDANVLINSPDERDAVFVPGKLYDYLMARRPIVFLGSPGDASRIVEDAEGYAFGYGELDPLANALTELARRDAPREAPRLESYGPERSFAPLLDRLSR